MRRAGFRTRAAGGGALSGAAPALSATALGFDKPPSAQGFGLAGSSFKMPLCSAMAWAYPLRSMLSLRGMLGRLTQPLSPRFSAVNSLSRSSGIHAPRISDPGPPSVRPSAAKVVSLCLSVAMFKSLMSRALPPSLARVGARYHCRPSTRDP